MIQTSSTSTTRLFADTISAAKRGDDRAWETLYRGLAGSVTGYLASRGASDAEDLTGEVFLQVARDIQRFEGDASSFRSWVFVIAHRRLIDSRRAAHRRPISEAQLSDETPGGNVEDEAIEHLALTHIREILDGLTDSQRDVLALRVIADLSLDETAQVMGKRVGAIKSLQRRAISSVREQLDKGRVTL